MSTQRGATVSSKPSRLETARNTLTPVDTQVLLLLLGGFQGTIVEVTGHLFPHSKPGLLDKKWSAYLRVYGALGRLPDKIRKIWDSSAVSVPGEEALRLLKERFLSPEDAITWLSRWKSESVVLGGKRDDVLSDGAGIRSADGDAYARLARLNANPDLLPPRASCSHYWVYEPPAGFASKGTCQSCKGEKYSLNFIPESNIFE